MNAAKAASRILSRTAVSSSPPRWASSASDALTKRSRLDMWYQRVPDSVVVVLYSTKPAETTTTSHRRSASMSAEFAFCSSIALSSLAWALVTSRYIWPRLRLLPNSEAIQPLLIIHSFRFLGLAFLVPGVVSPDLPPAFAHAAAYGDVIAATLAVLSLFTQSRGIGVLLVWIFNLWGTADLFNAFYRANTSGLAPGQLGATY